MTIKFFIANRAIPKGAEATIYVRVVNGKSFDRKVSTKLMVKPEWWDSNKENIKSRVLCNDLIRNEVNSEISKLRDYIFLKFSHEIQPNSLPNTWLVDCVNSYYENRENNSFLHDSSGDSKLDKVEKKIISRKIKESEFFEIYDKFVQRQNISESRARQYKVLKGTLQRYQLYVRTNVRGLSKYIIEIDKIDADFLAEFYSYVENEHTYFEKFPEIFKSLDKKVAPKQRSKNTMTDLFKKFRAFLNWSFTQEYINNKPFEKFKLESETYGTPFYLTIDELKMIHNTNFKDNPVLNIQKDVFVFQCCVGCRVGDLMKLKKTDIINGNIEYIPHKTIKATGKTVIVPLNKMAREIVDKYFNLLDSELLPFSSPQRYNDDIKTILELCEITRMVTVLDPLTRTEKKVPINTIATSHMARRTFIGNIYKKVKDPNLVASLTGHTEGSKAFSRYRDIDTEMKRELVGLLD